jgi:hypothetical protein
MKHYSDNEAPAKSLWTNNPESSHVAAVVSYGRSMTGVESLQCQMVQVGVSLFQTGGWTNHHGTILHSWPRTPA